MKRAPWMKRLLSSGSLLLCLATAYASPKLTIKVEGIHGGAKKNVEARLKAVSEEINKAGQNAYVISHAIEHIPSDIQQAMAPYGFFRPKMTSKQVKNNKVWQISYQIHPGPRVRVSQFQLRIRGAASHDKAFIHIEKHPGITVGKALHTEHYTALKQKLFDTASSRGYFEAKMQKSEIAINLRRHTAAITIEFDSGPRYLFGKTSFKQTELNLDFLRKYMGYRAGQKYNNHKLEKLRQNLVNSNYYNLVDVKTELNQKQRDVPIQVDLTPKKTKHYIVGAGFGTDTGPRLLLGFNWSPANQWGHQFNLSLKGASRNNYYTATYTIPGKNPVTDQYAISAGYATEDVPRGQANSKSLGVSYSTVYGHWQETWMLRYLNERYNLTDLPRTHSNMIIPSAQWIYLRANKLLNPTKGYKLTFNLAGALKQVLSHNSFFQASMEAKWLHTFHSHTRLITRGQIGYTAIENIDNLPLSLQLLAGGTESVRGYSYDSIGPGRYMTVASLELQQRIKGNFYIGAFYDVGSVSNQYLKDLQQGVGPSLVYVSPIGDVELSIAKPLSIPGNHWRIQFSMGPAL